jgi:hypothetical protein
MSSILPGSAFHRMKSALGVVGMHVRAAGMRREWLKGVPVAASDASGTSCAEIGS